MSAKVVRLNRSIYGLKQASRSWHSHLPTRMATLGFEQCAADARVLRLIENEYQVCICYFCRTCRWHFRIWT